MILLAAFLWTACDKEDVVIKESGRVTFSFSKREINGGRTQTVGTPTAIVLNVENLQGQVVLESRKLLLVGFGDNYITENVALEIGNYKITSFIVLNENNKALYATPVAGSAKAQFVSTPLPISFNVGQTSTTTLRPEVLEVESTDSPEKFGYASFGFDIVAGDKVNVLVRVELTVGEIRYQDVDTKVRITGFNSANEPQWMQEYSYVGPTTNLFPVKKGFHHYEFYVNHWGIADRQVFSGQQLLEGADPHVPFTYVLGGSKAAKKLSYYVTYIERPDPAEWGKTYLDPQTTVEYAYGADGKVAKMKIYGYVDSLATFKEQRYFDFAYTNGKVSKISGYHLGQTVSYIEDNYTYANGKVSKIEQVNRGSGINTEVSIEYAENQQLVTAAYTLSNNTSFSYQFNYSNGNITADKTSRYGIICNTGTYTRDKNINPLAQLGYLDFFFRNYSINNKIAENVNYTGCAFPTLIPESYVYVYDNDGYPTEEKTLYKGSNLVMTTKYYYQ